MKKQGVFLNEIKAESTDAVIDIVGVIGWEVAFTELKKMFLSLPESVKRVCFDIYSPGGDVWDGNGIVTAIGELGKRCETVARVQVAASMATLIAVACQKRSIASNGRFLIHNVWTSVSGDAAELEKRAKELRDCEVEAANFYASRTGKTADEMLTLMNEERWLTPAETVAFGFVTAIDDPFNPDEVAAVNAEIQAAGKWPQSLVEIPKAAMVGKCMDCVSIQKETNPPCAACGSQNVVEVNESECKKEKDDGNADTEGGKGGVEGKQDDAGNASNSAVDTVAIESAAFERGRADGVATGRNEEAARIADQITALNERVKKSDALASKHQGERDALQARITAMEKSHATQIKVLTENLNTATDRVRKFCDGALTFSPALPESWEDALKSCGGDYEKAAKQYPDLRKAFNERKKTK